MFKKALNLFYDVSKLKTNIVVPMCILIFKLFLDRQI